MKNVHTSNNSEYKNVQSPLNENMTEYSFNEYQMQSVKTLNYLSS